MAAPNRAWPKPIGFLTRYMSQFAGVICTTLALGIVLTTLLTMVRAYLPMPLLDQWEELTPQDHFVRLFSPHNEHVLTFPRLIFVVDKEFFGGSNIFNQTVIFIVQLIHAGLLWVISKRSGLPALLSAALISSFLFWCYQYENFILGFQVQFVGVCATATAAFFIVGFRRERGILWAIALCFMATLTMANGLLVGLLLVSLALLVKLPRKQLLGLIASSLAMVIMFVSLQHAAHAVHDKRPILEALSKSIGHPQPVLTYMGVYLGGPFGRLLFRSNIQTEQAVLVSSIIGILGIGIWLIAGAILYRRWRHVESPDTGALVLAHIALFAVASALVTAVGRSEGFPIYQAFSGRYGAVVLVFWLCTGLVLWHLALPSRIWSDVVPSAISILVCLVLAASQIFIMRLVLTGSLPDTLSFAGSQQHALAGRLPERTASLTAILSSVSDSALMESIYPRPNELQERIPRLRAAHMAPFNESWSRWLGRNLPADISISDHGCNGRLLEVQPLETGKWRILGWADVNSGHLGRIVILSATGVVIGYGLRLPGNTLAEALTDSNHCWVGHVSAVEGARVTAYALDDSGETACSIGSFRLYASVVLQTRLWR